MTAPAAPPGPRIVSFDLMPNDPDYYFVLTQALGDFAARTRAEVEDESAPESHMRWAETAESALERIEEALSAPATPTDPVETLHRIANQDIGGNAPWLADELHGFADRLAASMRADSPQSCYFWDIRAGECRFEVLVPGCSPCAACPGGDAPDVARRYSFTRAALVDALAHLVVSVPATGPAAGAINAESMADAIIEALRSETP